MPTTFEIFPAIGIARVGSSTDFFVGPEPDVPLDLRRRDAAGNLLRQAARFRIYECDRDGNGLLQAAREVTAAEATIEWSVHLANRKAAAKRFQRQQGESPRRNNATGNDLTDQALIIDPGVKEISTGDAPVPLDGGGFLANPVSLGRLEVQADGRLCVIGGDGSSNSPTGALLVDDGVHFADNDHWHDNVGDGPVRAHIIRGGKPFDAVPAWVIVAPPDFAPEIVNVVTLYDVLFDLAVTRNILAPASTIFFDEHVRPILERALNMQWVNRQARQGYDGTHPPGGHGPGGRGDFSGRLATPLGDPDPTNNFPRMQIFRLLRDPATLAVPSPVALKHMPRLNDDTNSGEVLPLTRQQFRAMQLWSQGQFQGAGQTQAKQELLPDSLTRVALEACTGGGFFPGIEAGIIMRDATIYAQGEAFRISPTVVKPGGITERNAVPWQADFRLCEWEGGSNLGWWPAQRPDDILKNVGGSPVPWTRGLAHTEQSMVNNWHRLGFVKSDPANPGTFIEQDRDATLQENSAV